MAMQGRLIGVAALLALGACARPAEEPPAAQPAELFQAQAAPAEAAPAAAAPIARASAEQLRARLRALFPPACRVDEVRLVDDGAQVLGWGENNAAIVQAMRAIDTAHAGGAVLGNGPAVDLSLVEQRQDGRYHYVMNLRSQRLLAQ